MVLKNNIVVLLCSNRTSWGVALEHVCLCVPPSSNTTVVKIIGIDKRFIVAGSTFPALRSFSSTNGIGATKSPGNLWGSCLSEISPPLSLSQHTRVPFEEGEQQRETIYSGKRWLHSTLGGKAIIRTVLGAEHYLAQHLFSLGVVKGLQATKVRYSMCLDWSHAGPEDI